MSNLTRRGHVFTSAGPLTFLFAAGMLATGTLGTAHADTDTNELLDRMADVTGMETLPDHTNGIALRGTARFQDTDATFELWIHPDGRFRRWIQGPLSEVVTFDGATYRERNWMNTVQELEMAAAEEARMTVWLHTGAWLAGEDLVDIEAAASGGQDDADDLDGLDNPRLNVQLHGGLYRGLLEVDATTHRAVRFKHQTVLSREVYTYSGSIALADLTFAKRIDFFREGLPPDWIEITEAEDLAAGEFASPDPLTRTYEDVTFDPDIPSRLEVRVAPTGHLLVPVRMDGGEPGWFIFDSGAGAMCVSTTAPQLNDMEAVGSVEVGGVGGATVGHFRQGKTLQVGPATVDDPIYVELELDFLTQVMGARIDGVVGYDFLARVVAEIAYDDGIVEIHDPATYELPGSEWRDLVLHERHPCVQATVEGSDPHWFKLDTGAAASTVTFHAPFTRHSRVAPRSWTGATPSPVARAASADGSPRGTAASAAFNWAANSTRICRRSSRPKTSAHSETSTRPATSGEWC